MGYGTIKAISLLGLLTGMFMLMGWYFGGKSGLQTALFMAVLLNGFVYFFSDRIVLGMFRARPLDRDRFGAIFEIVQELTEQMKLPMPRLWLVDSRLANAFATGRNAANASIGVTTALLGLLDSQQLRGVLAHELGHVKNKDILINSIAGTLAGAIGYLANSMQHMLFWRRKQRDNERQKGGNLTLLLLALVMPIAALMVRLAVTRSRELEADDTGAYYSRDPLALASALQALQDYKQQHYAQPWDAHLATVSHLLIVSPFNSQSLKKITALFSTHPPVEVRIERLRAIYNKMVAE